MENKSGEAEQETCSKYGSCLSIPYYVEHFKTFKSKHFQYEYFGKSLIIMTASLLFTANGFTLQKLRLNYSDVNLVRYSSQKVVRFSVIQIKNMKIIGQIGEDSLTSIWLDDVDPGRSINFIQGLLVFQGICNGLCGV